MSSATQGRSRWMSMVGLSIAAVVIPFLVYWMVIYRSQYQHEINRNFRVLAEVERELAFELEQMGYTFQYAFPGRESMLLQVLAALDAEWRLARAHAGEEQKRARHLDPSATATGTPAPAADISPAFRAAGGWNEGAQAALLELAKAPGVESTLVHDAVRALIPSRGTPQWSDATLVLTRAVARLSLAEGFAGCCGHAWQSVAQQAAADPSTMWSDQNRDAIGTASEAVRAAFVALQSQSLAAMKKTPGYENLELSFLDDPAKQCGDRRTLVYDLKPPKLEVLDCRPDSERNTGARQLPALEATIPLSDFLDLRTARRSFQAVLAFDDKGAIIHRSGDGSASEVSVVDVDEFVGAPAASDSAAAGGASKPKKDTLRGVSLPTQQKVTIAGVVYEAFVQRIVLPFPHARDDSKQVFLAGVVSSQRLQSSVIQIRLTILGFLIAAVVLAGCALPFIKVAFIGALEQLRPLDVYKLALGLLLGCGVVAITVAASVAYHGEILRLRSETTTVAARLAEEFRTELEAVHGRLESEQQRLLAGIQDDSQPGACEYDDLVFETPKPGTAEARRHCPEQAYPTYENLVFLDAQGDMRGPVQSCREKGIRSVRVQNRDYFRRIVQGPAYWMPTKGAVDAATAPLGVAEVSAAAPIGLERLEPGRPFFADRIRTRDHGVKLAAVSIPVTRSDGDGHRVCGRCGVCVAVIVQQFRTFWLRLLPQDMAFAVVNDRDGAVLFHSDDSRSLVENFFTEIEGNLAATTAITSRREHTGSILYRGNWSLATVKPLQHVPWALVVFSDKNRIATGAFEAAMVAAVNYVAFVLLFALGLSLTSFLLGRGCWAWAWPQPQQTGRYLVAALVTFSIGTGGFLLILSHSGWSAVVIALALPALLLSGHYLAFGPTTETRDRREVVARAVVYAAIVMIAAGGGYAAYQGRAVYAWIALAFFTGAAMLWRRSSGSEVGNVRVAGAHAACMMSLLVAISINPALALFWDAWAVAGGKLALHRAEHLVLQERELDAAYARDIRRLYPKRSEAEAFGLVAEARAVPSDDRRTALCSPPALHTRGGEVVAATQSVSAVCELGDGRCSEHIPPAPCRLIDKLLLGGQERWWACGYATAWLGLRAPNYTPFAARLNVVTSDGTGGGGHWEGLPSADDAGAPEPGRSSGAHRFHWVLGGMHGQAQYDAFASPVAPVAWDDGSVFLLLIGLTPLGFYVLFLAIRSVSRNVFAIDLLAAGRASGAAVAPADLPYNFVLTNGDAANAWLDACVHPERVSATVVDAWEVASRDPAPAPVTKKEHDSAWLVVRSVEATLVDSNIRRRVLELLEVALREGRAIVLCSATWPVTRLTQAAPVEHHAAHAPAAEAPPPPAGKASAEKETSALPAATSCEPETPAEALRWSTVLALFHEPVGGPSADPFHGDAAHAGIDREAMYRKQWNLCTLRERMALLHLARGHLANPRNLDAIESLMRRGLLHRAPDIRFTNSGFRKFAKTAEPEHNVISWLREADVSTWSVVRMPLMLTLAAGVAFVAFVSQEALTTTIGVMSAVATGVPLLVQVAGSIAGTRARGGNGKA